MGDLSISGPPQVKNLKHRVFADAYLRGISGTKAAIEAGYAPGNAGVEANRLLKRPDVAEYVSYHQSKAAEITEVDKVRLTRELSHLAFSSVEHFSKLETDGTRSIDYTNATSDQLKAISGIKTKKRKIYDGRGNVVAEEVQSEFKLWDKIRAAELLGKDIGMFKEPEQKIVVDVADRLLAARQRIRAAVEAQTIEHSDD